MYTPLDNRIIGQSIAKLRSHREKKAIELAKYLKLSEAAYTKYERGETAITIPFINQIASFFDINPIELLQNKPDNIVENIHNSTIAVQSNSTFSSIDKNLIETLINQITIKDKQLERADEKIKTLIEITKQKL